MNVSLIGVISRIIVCNCQREAVIKLIRSDEDLIQKRYYTRIKTVFEYGYQSISMIKINSTLRLTV